MIVHATRSKERVKKEFVADLIVNGKTYGATIENISESGIKVRVATEDSAEHFWPDRGVELQFDPPSGVTVRLACRVVWSSRTSARSLFVDVGLEINDTTQLYNDFLKTLSVTNIMMLMDNCV